jgi:hypothetical protein
MYLVPVLVAVDAPDPAHAEHQVETDLRDRAVHVDAARLLSKPRTALTDFHLLVYADGLELPPAPRGR